jgi:hypothetical protein
MYLNAFYDQIPSILTVLKVAYIFANDVHISFLLNVIFPADKFLTYTFTYRCVTLSEHVITLFLQLFWKHGDIS